LLLLHRAAWTDAAALTIIAVVLFLHFRRHSTSGGLAG
jgi:hypothetical protein